MATNNYVAKFGDSIRRLAALDLAAQGNPNLAGAGPQPVTGAFDVAPQYQQRDPAKEPLNQPGVFPSGEGSGQQPQGAISAPPAGPFGADVNPQKLWDEMPASARKKVIRQVENKGIDINKVYDEKVAAGEIVPPERVLSKGERLSVLAETLLRHARNVGQGQPGGAASANAILETQGRRGGLEQAAAQREAEIKEMLRQEGRTDTKEATKRAETLEDERRKRGETIVDKRREQRAKDADREDTQAHERALKQAELAAQNAGKNVERFTSADGTVVLIDKGSNTVIPLEVETEETVVTPGTRGRPALTEKRKGKKPLKGVPTNSAGGTATLDPDTVANRTFEFESKLAAGEYKNEIKARMKEAGITREQAIEQLRRQALSGVVSGNTSGDDPLGILD